MALMDAPVEAVGVVLSTVALVGAAVGMVGEAVVPVVVVVARACDRSGLARSLLLALGFSQHKPRSRSISRQSEQPLRVHPIFACYDISSSIRYQVLPTHLVVV